MENFPYEKWAAGRKMVAKRKEGMAWAECFTVILQVTCVMHGAHQKTNFC